MSRAVFMCMLLALSAMANAATAPLPPRDLGQRAGFDQRLGAAIPMDLSFRDTDGRDITLKEAAAGKPLLLALGYYRCPNLCDLVLHGIAAAISAMPLQVGSDYQVAFLSVDPREKPADAEHSAAMLQRMNPSARIPRWHLLTGTEPSIGRLADAVGFHYFYDARNRQYAHPAGLVLLSGEGKVVQYFFGVGYPPSALRLAIVGASRGKLGNVIDQLVLLCCDYDPSTGRYNLLIGRLMQIFGVGFVLLMAACGLWYRRRAQP